VLDAIQARGFVLGSNLKGGAADDPSWLFLLPELNPSAVRFVGHPLREVSEALERMSSTVDVQPLPSPSEEPDLVVVTTGRSAGRPGRRSGTDRDLSGLDEGTPVVVFADRQGLEQGPGSAFASLVRTLNAGRVNTLTKGPPGPDALPGSGGRDGLIIPHGPQEAGRARDLARVAKETSKRLDAAVGGGLGRVRSRLGRTGGGNPDIALRHPSPGAGPGQVAIILPSGTAATTPPRYLIRLAADHGYDISRHRWAIAPPRGYRSQKVLFFLYEDGSSEADLVIKLTQDRAFNDRLSNEAAALKRLNESGAAAPGTIPSVLFSGEVAGLTVVAETALRGEPFRERSSGLPTCEFAGQALDWIVGLGKQSAEPGTRSDWSTTLTSLVDQYVGFYRPEAPEQQQLRALVDTVVKSDQSPPTVFQHGDPGNWNLLVMPNDQVGFLDWESAESHGAPLWDLFVFIKTYAAWGARRAGRRYSADVFEEQLLRNSPYRRMLIDETARYCEKVGVDPETVDALFVFCWVYQSLKEVGRLRRTGPRNGSNARLVAKCLAALRDRRGIISLTLP
jgi:hypothetical protein